MKKNLLLLAVSTCFLTLALHSQNRVGHVNSIANHSIVNDAPERHTTCHGTVINAPANGTISRKSGSPLSTQTITGYYREDFEGGFPPAGWQIVDIADPLNTWMQSSASPYSGAKSAYLHYPNIGVYGEDWLILPQYTVATTDSFSFWLKPQFVNFPDTTFILISTTDSALGSFTTVVDVLIDQVNYPLTSIYQQYSYSLSAFAGQNIYVAFRNANVYGDGIYIDRVAIGTRPPDAASVSIDIPKFAALGTINPKATFKNDGDSIISFPVTMNISGGYTSTKNVSNLAPNATIQITFDPWTTTAPITAAVSIQTHLIGDTFLADDTLSTGIVVMETFTNYGWSVRPNMPALNANFPSAAINNNISSSLFAFGGNRNFSFTVSDTSDRFMPISNAWVPSNATARMIKGVSYASAATVQNKIYVAGGYDNNSAVVNNNQIYNPASNSWSSGFVLPFPVEDYAVGVYKDSLIFYMGGYSGSADRNSVQLFAPSSILWVPATAMPFAGSQWRGGIIGNKIVVTGGFSNTSFTSKSSTYIGTINPAFPYIITWTTGPDYPSGVITQSAGGASLDEASGLVLFTGGDPTPTGNGTQAVDYTFAYDINSNQWKVGPPKPTPAYGLCNFTPVVDNDTLYMVALGGITSTGQIAANEWLNMGHFQLVVGVKENNVSSLGLSCSPNPVTAVAKIEFSLVKSANVKAVIVDALGNELEVLISKNLNTGSQQLTWNSSAYANGIYLCKVTVDGNTSTQKIVKY